MLPLLYPAAMLLGSLYFLSNDKAKGPVPRPGIDPSIRNRYTYTLPTGAQSFTPAARSAILASLGGKGLAPVQHGGSGLAFRVVPLANPTELSAAQACAAFEAKGFAVVATLALVGAEGEAFIVACPSSQVAAVAGPSSALAVLSPGRAKMAAAPVPAAFSPVAPPVVQAPVAPKPDAIVQILVKEALEDEHADPEALRRMAGELEAFPDVQKSLRDRADGLILRARLAAARDAKPPSDKPSKGKKTNGAAATFPLESEPVTEVVGYVAKD